MIIYTPYLAPDSLSFIIEYAELQLLGGPALALQNQM